MTDWARYLYWLRVGRCQICGEQINGDKRLMCRNCEEEINKEAEQAKWVV